MSIEVLADALHAALRESTARKLGDYLKRHQGRIVAGLRIERAGTYQRAVMWRCVEAR